MAKPKKRTYKRKVGEPDPPAKVTSKRSRTGKSVKFAVAPDSPPGPEGASPAGRAGRGAASADDLFGGSLTDPYAFDF